MQRRTFLRGLFGVAAAAAVAPLAKFIPAPAPIPAAAPVISATIGQYADYISISDLAIDPYVEEAAKELAYRLGLTLDALVRNTIDASSKVYCRNSRELARYKRGIRRERFVAKQRRRSVRMAA